MDSRERAAREALWARIPGIDIAPIDAKQTAAYELANTYGIGKHSQKCPVWERRTGLSRCNCWILRDAISTVEDVVNSIERFNAAGSAS